MNTTIQRPRPAPLAVRLSEKEKAQLADAANALGVTRNALVRRVAMGLVRELREGQLMP